MRFLFYYGHPVQYLSMPVMVRRLLAKPNNHVAVLIKTKDVMWQPYIVVRLSELAAHHDIDVHGIDSQLLKDIIYEVAKRQGYQLWIRSEGLLSESYRQYQLLVASSQRYALNPGPGNASDSR